MGKQLVIVESPAKAKTINKILGADFVVKASMGHVRDLPQKEIGIDVEKRFKPKYVNIAGRAKVLKELSEIAASADRVLLAPDPDREGEAIAWHLREALKKAKPAGGFARVTYNEITAPAIRAAFAHPGEIDQRRVDSQQARRVLDRLVGYKVSPLLWRRIRGASSAGRVQSVALRLVCEREEAIRTFKPEEYWLLGARVRKQVDPREPFDIRLSRIDDKKAEVTNGEQAARIREDLEGRELRVSNLTSKEVSKRPPPPFNTSALQQAASSALGLAPAMTMRIAQKLYEGVDFGEGPVGLITYMRTDSFNIARSAQDACRAWIHEHHGEAFVPEKPNVYRSRAGAQEAHEAIRPTDPARAPDGRLEAVLQPQEFKLYRLIWQRFVASQMAPARIAQRGAEIDAVPPPGASARYLFRASASEVVFPGYMAVLGVEKRKKDDQADEVDQLPPLTVGEALDRLEWLSEQKFTTPPARYSEASLVRAMEENGVGRPSTYAQTISTLLNRKYVDKDKRNLLPTALGEKVNAFLVVHLSELFEVGFTAAMEQALDEIEEGKVEWTGMMQAFYERFLGWLEQAKGPPADTAEVERLLELAARVTVWQPAVTGGKRAKGDEAFVASIREQLAEGRKAISARQVGALKKVLARYLDQLGDDEPARALGAELSAETLEAAQPPRPETARKLALLEGLDFNPPRTVGKRVYDDKKFVGSLRDQVRGGRRLTENQLGALNRLLERYAGQIEGLDGLRAELKLDEAEARPDDPSVGPLLEMLGEVSAWREPVARGKRTWDDKGFFESLQRQFKTKGRLSEKQVAALKKLVGRYREQVRDFDARVEALGVEIKAAKPRAESPA